MNDIAAKYELEEYTLGSGHLRISKLPTDWTAFLNEFCKRQDNILGRIKGGASFLSTRPRKPRIRTIWDMLLSKR